MGAEARGWGEEGRGAKGNDAEHHSGGMRIRVEGGLEGLAAHDDLS